MFTIGQLAKYFGEPAWKVRLAVDRALPNCQRFGLYRVVRAEELPLVERELAEAPAAVAAG